MADNKVTPTKTSEPKARESINIPKDAPILDAEAEIVRQCSELIYGRRAMSTQWPYIHVIEPSSDVTAGSYSSWTEYEFEFDTTILAMVPAVRGSSSFTGVAPIPDFRVEIERSLGEKYCSNLPFSIRALCNDGIGIDFIDMYGMPLYVQAGSRIWIKFYNDQSSDMRPSINFIGFRGYVRDFGGGIVYSQEDVYGLEPKNVTNGFIGGLALLPYVYVMKKTSTTIAAGGSYSTTANFSSCYTLFGMRWACQATAEGTGVADFRAKIDLPGGIRQYPYINGTEYPFSLRAATADNTLDFIDVTGEPLLIDHANDDRITYTVYNDYGTAKSPSIELITIRERLAEKAIQRLLDNRRKYAS